MSEFNLGGASIIVLLCYLIVEALKILAGGREKIIALLPIMSAFLGGGMGLIIMRLAPELIASSNYIEAFVFGVICGLGATGSNQIYKQIKNLFKK